MRIRKKKPMTDDQAMNSKVTIKEFFIVHLKVLRTLVSRHKLDTVVILALLCSLTLKDTLNLKYVEYITNAVLGLHKAGQQTILKNIVLIVVMFIGLILLSYILNWIYERFDARYKEKVRYDVERDFHEKLSIIPYENFESNQFHEKVNRARAAGEQYSQAIYGIAQLFRILITMIVYGVLLSRISWIFPVIIIFSNIITFYVSGIVTDKQLDYWRRHVSPSTRRLWYFQNVMNNRINQQTIQAGRLFPYFARLFQKWNVINMKSYISMYFLSFSTELLSVAIQAIVYGSTALYIGNQVVAGEVEIGYFTMVIALLISLFGIMKEYTYFVLNGNWYVKILTDYFDIMSTDEAVKTNTSHSGEFSFISLDNVSYKYPQSDKYALKNISCTFKRGERIAIVGRNGSGKTTLMGVLMGLFNNFEGKLSIDDNDCSTGNILYLSDSVSFLMQDFGQYQMTIKQNIELGNKGNNLTDEKVMEILKSVGLYEYISSLEKGIYTSLGQLENGIELSKGQWQKVGIARLLANNKAKIWILDEPTAYLDPISEIEMYNLIYSLASDQLVFFISHRLGFASKADRILVLDEGTIVEQGNHVELLAKGGIYKEMFNAQKSWYS